jgi:phage FluMu gp28-like protein
VLRERGEIDIASTPKGRGNLFCRLGENRMFGRSVVTLPEAIAAGLRVDMEEVRAAIGDDVLFRQEFLCEFLGEASAFLSYELIRACEDSRLGKEPDSAVLGSARADVYAGVDVGRVRDLTVIWLLERAGEELITRGVVEMSGRPFREQFEVLREVLEKPAVRRCCLDASGLGMQLGEMAVEAFGEHRVEAMQLTRAIKESLAGRLRLAIKDGRLRIPADEGIRRDLHSVQRTVTVGGHARLDAERGADGHGDRFWAAALAVNAAGEPAGRAEYMGTGTVAFSREGAW